MNKIKSLSVPGLPHGSGKVQDQKEVDRAENQEIQRSKKAELNLRQREIPFR